MAYIVVAFPKMEDAVSIKNLLVKNGYLVAAVCTSGAKVLSTIDSYNEGIIVCGYKLKDMIYSELRENVPMEFEMLLLASPAKIGGMKHEGVIPVAMPLRVGDLINTVAMLSINIERRRKKLKHMPKKRSKEEQKTIDKAKKILMEKHCMTEEEAYRYLQKTSMDSGTGLVETAEMVICIMMNIY